MRLINQLFNKLDPFHRYFITTPIFYVNADPHIGHVHTLVVTDALHRLAKLKGAKSTIFSTGTDEHGLKIQRAAQARGRKPQDFCDEVSKRFLDLCSTFNISNTHFIRTSDGRHARSVQSFWTQLMDQGLIYKKNYSGWYSVPDETFLPASQIEVQNIDGREVRVSSESGHVLEWFEEDNYMFKLSQFEGPLMDLLDSGRLNIKPNLFHNLVINLLKQGLNDISISRPTTRLSWGVPVPEDEAHRVYVWLDALVNYLTVSGYPETKTLWPPDCHVIGKDIIKFHAIYWPAFLLAAGMKVPRQIICHSHWTIEGTKMSKSRGNVVDPFSLLQKYSPESIRYFLLRQSVPHDDGKFCESQMISFLNLDLADTFGNLLSRCCAPKINLKQIYPATPDSQLLSQLPGIKPLLESLVQLGAQVDLSFSEARFYVGIEAILNSLRLANKLVQESKPWELAKDPSQESKLYAVIYIIFETLKISGILMQPVIPKMASKLLDKLSVPDEERDWSKACLSLNNQSTTERNLNPNLDSILFTRIR